jgi:hypothetical protein
MRFCVKVCYYSYMENEALGVDIGNVIIEHRHIMDTTDETLWHERYSTLPPVENMFESLRKLNDEIFHGNIFLISKLKEEHDTRTLAWLKDNDFFRKTNILPENVLFCRERSEKVKLCEENNIKYFIDDRLEVLSHMIGHVPKLYLFNPNPEEVAEFKQFLSKVIVVKKWSDLIDNTKEVKKLFIP